MGGDQDEDVLEEDVLVVDGEGQEGGSQEATAEVEHHVDDAPFGGFVDLKDQGAELRFAGFFSQEGEFSKEDG